MPASTTAAPLVPRRRKRGPKQSWWNRNVTKPLNKLNPAILFRKKPNLNPRTIYVNEPLPADFYDKKGKVIKSRLFCSNQNITSKYTVITFLPRNLLEQFRRVANIFFLFIDILQFFPKFATISPGLVILPLIIVLAVTALKDGYEDWKRHQADFRVNHSIVHTLRGGDYENPNPTASKDKTFIKGIPLPHRKKKANLKAEEEQPTVRRSEEELHRVRTEVSHWEDDLDAVDTANGLGWHRTIWEDLKVGDFIKIYDNEQIPADVVICATSGEEDVCYIETKNLDGETNLKSRHAVNGLVHLDTAAACAKVKMRLDMDAPDVNMYRLNGAIIVDGDDNVHPVTLDTCLLRGCVLRNTNWVIAIVAFTGDDSKIVQNSGGAPSKRSKVERQMNPQVLFNLGVLGLIGMVCGIVDHFLEKKWVRQNTYWTLWDDRSGDNPNINGLITFFNALITFQNIIPISLYISIEFVRTVQALFIFWDHNMQYFKNGVKYRTIARTWNLSDDLGQIEYIFSDKTGTLTQNVMVFRQCSVGGKVYVGDAPKATDGNGRVEANDLKPATSESDNSEDGLKDRERPEAEVIPPFHDTVLEKDLEQYDTDQSRILYGFFTVLGLCHTAMTAEAEDGTITYKSQSPDEGALVQAAADVGFVFRGRDRNILKLQTPYSREPEEYELLNILEFNSSRKRMSVIVRKLDEEGRILLLTKGADNIIFERLSSDASQTELREKTDKDLQDFANEGLRTLCLAYRVINPQEYEEWNRDYHNAEVALEDREAKIDEMAAVIEKDLQLLGSTAIEDKLQDGVPETIAALKRAGIKVWVATGDKLETAIAIGYTTNLLTPDTNLIIIRDGHHTIYEQLRDSLEGFFGENNSLRRSSSIRRSMSLSHQHTRRSTQLQRVNTGVQDIVGEGNGTRPGGFSLVIEGHALEQAFADPDTSDLLLNLSIQCNTVICCRVSPLQKAQIVRLIKDNLGVMCLAIGDGANDVSMIQAADVGVGISGEEGLQAVNSSDFSTAQFRFLKRLLFVHGHWSYFRNSTMICNFFYKNILGMGVLFWYQIYCGWSSTYVYNYVYLLFWNVFWTLCPVIAIGLFERNLDADILMSLPELYRYSRSGRYYNWPRFLYYMFEGVFQTAVIFFFLNYTYDVTTTRGDGWEVYKDEMSTTMAIAGAMVANLFSGLNIDAWSWWVVFGVWFGPFLIWVFTAVYSVVKPTTYISGVYGNDLFLFRSAAYWFSIPFAVVIALLPRYLIKFTKQNIIPTDIDIMRLVRKYNPNVDIDTDPMLGGKLRVENADGQEYAESLRSRHSGIFGMHIHPHREPTPEPSHSRHSMSTTDDKDNIPMSTIPTPTPPPAASSPPPTYPPVAGRQQSYRNRPSFESRPSFHSNRSYRGAAMDMSTGLAREPSRGFDFTMEESGVAIHRMQSRLSQNSYENRKPHLSIRRLGGGGRGKDKEHGGPNPSPLSRAIRERAGSILRPGRNRSGTTATGKSNVHSEISEDNEHGLATSPTRRQFSVTQISAPIHAAPMSPQHTGQSSHYLSPQHTGVATSQASGNHTPTPTHSQPLSAQHTGQTGQTGHSYTTANSYSNAGGRTEGGSPNPYDASKFGHAL